MDALLPPSRRRIEYEGGQTITADALSLAASLLGRKGGTVTSQRMTIAQRRAKAIKATTARWDKVRKAKKENHNGSSR